MPPPPGDACQGLAYVFRLIGENKDRGMTKREQIQLARGGVGNPFALDPERALHSWLRMIELVYRRPDANAREIQAMALRACTVNDRGQVVLLWPKPQP